MVIAGERDRFPEIESRLQIQPAPKPKQKPAAEVPPEREGLYGKATDYIKRLLSSEIKIAC